jgi:hypothetical protein
VPHRLRRLETSFRRALVESQSDPTVFVTQPVSVLFLILAFASVLAPLKTHLRPKSPVALFFFELGKTSSLTSGFDCVVC